jgi:hypothetical protein
MVLIRPGAPSETTSHGAGSPRRTRSRPRSSQSSWRSRWPSRTATNTRLPWVVYPQATRTPSFSPVGRVGQLGARVSERRCLPGRGSASVVRAPEVFAPSAKAVPLSEPAGALARRGPSANESDRRFPGETSCLSLCWAVLDIFIPGARGLGLSDLEYRQVVQLKLARAHQGDLAADKIAYAALLQQS